MNGVQHIPTILPVLIAGWLMVVAGLGKKRLERRPPRRKRPR